MCAHAVFDIHSRIVKALDQTHVIFDIHTRIVKALDQGNLACSVFLDFAKVFDTFDHHILLQKLENFGLRGPVFKWYESYLSNRTQKVKIGSVFSDEKPITCGVPQGSILGGPILFLLYINDIKNSSRNLSSFLFADGTSTLLISKSIDEIEKTYNSELEHLTNWLNANKLSYIDKSNLVLFRKQRNKIARNIHYR